MTDLTCKVTEETKGEIEKLLNSKKKLYTLILLCNKKTLEITVQHILDDFQGSAAAEIADNLPESSPRFIISRHDVTLDNHYDQAVVSFIHFNPLDTDSHIKRMYIQSKGAIQALLPKNTKVFELSVVEDFTEDWFSHKIIGITGKAN